MQGITAVVKELHLKFPTVDYHDGTLQLAVGAARPAGNRPWAQQTHVHHAGLTELPHAAADEEPVAVFDMRLGAKTRVLHFGCVCVLAKQKECHIATLELQFGCVCMLAEQKESDRDSGAE
jgi:hypothetical protein